ncbi:MAG: YgiW/YdeI family stress tolerance OB fold protein [Deltaproteobacteria bacterium]|nr:YgiW/YdeI family stress tolerance OB fold protein [Deltaproteobacteria bacterium]
MAILSCSAFAAATQGGFQTAPSATGGGFSGSGVSVSTVEQALTMRDDAWVILRGNIVQHVGKDKYLFQDATGSIRVEIDHDEWGGQIVTPADLVEIKGEIDKDWNSVEVEVEHIAKVQ